MINNAMEEIENNDNNSVIVNNTDSNKIETNLKS